MSDNLNFTNLVDVFDEKNYPKDADGLTQVPAQDIYGALQQLFPNGYQEQTSEGFYPDGRNYVRLTISVADPNGGPFRATVTGYAESEPGREMSFAGLLTMARRQAVLRGLHMGHSMYSKHVERETTTRAATSAPTKTMPPASSTGYRPSYSGGGGGYRGGGGTRKPFANDGSDWTGTARIKSDKSPHCGKQWKELPLEVVEKMASGSNPIQLAVWELNRRAAESGGMVEGAVESAVEEAVVDAAIESGRAAAPAGVAGAMSTSSFSFRR